jgi:hypothetical protein
VELQFGLFQWANKKPDVFTPGFLFTTQTGLTRLDIGGLLSLWALNNFESHFLTFFQRLETRHVDRGEMREQILAAVIGSDETKTLCIIEPLYSTVCHAQLPYKNNGWNARQIV